MFSYLAQLRARSKVIFKFPSLLDLVNQLIVSVAQNGS